MTDIKFDWIMWTWDNIHADALEQTWIDYAKNASDMAAQNEANLKRRAEEEKALIITRDADKRDRAEDIRAKWEAIETKSKADAELRRTDAEWIVKQQDEISSRQANQAVARSWEAWLVLSSWVLQGILDDTAAVYWNNIKSAEEFKLKTNLDLDTALTNLSLSTVNNEKAVNLMLDVLDDAEAAPMLNAIAKAAEWDKKALDDVYSFYQETLREMKTGQYQRADILERQKAQETQWTNSDAVARLNDIDWALWKTPWYNEIAWLVPWLLADYPDLSRAAFTAKIKELAQKNLNLQQQTLAQIWSSKEYWDELKIIKDTMEAASDTTISSSDRDTYSQNKWDSTNTWVDSIWSSRYLPVSNYKWVSIVDYLTQQWIDNSPTNRSKLAVEYWVKYNTGPNNWTENTALLKAMIASEWKEVTTSEIKRDDTLDTNSEKLKTVTLADWSKRELTSLERTKWIKSLSTRMETIKKQFKDWEITKAKFDKDKATISTALNEIR